MQTDAKCFNTCARSNHKEGLFRMTTSNITSKASLKLPNTSGIYMITCTANGKIYIGSAVNLSARWRDHCRCLRSNKHDNRHLQNAWDKYGKTSFKFTVLEKCSVDLLLEREQIYLDEWQPFDDRGFNIAKNSTAPMRGRKHLPETLVKMSTTHKGRKATGETRAKMRAAQTGRTISPEHRSKLSETNMGKKHSPETRAKISAANKGRKMSPEAIAKTVAANKGRTLAPEHRAKLSAANCKYRYIIIHPGGEIFETQNLKAFCCQHGLDFGNMYKLANSKRKSHKGWIVRRIDPSPSDD